MYSVGIFSNISELTTFPFANIKKFAEHNFLQIENYEFSLYTKDQKEIFLAKVQTGGFDGIVFATNTANDATLKKFFESDKSKSVFRNFLAAGKGILILLQCQLAKEQKFFNILTAKDFPGLKGTIIQTKQNNDESNVPFKYSKTMMKFHEDDLIFHYPRDVIENNDKENYNNDAFNFLYAMKNSPWQRGICDEENKNAEKEILLPFAYISSYPKEDFRSVIDYNNDRITGENSFCIISRNVNKRVAITTLALDLDQNYFLENLISYIARGEPSVFFKPCGKCGENGGRCDFVDLLYNTKIHFSDNELIKPMVKYEILTCGESPISTNASKDPHGGKDSIPTKQLMPIANSSGQICRCINTSSVRYMCKLGAQYLKIQLNNGKYGSLIGTLTTLRFFKMINLKVPKIDQEAILGYLKKHNEDSTFDHIKRSTNIAQQIVEALELKDSKIMFISKDAEINPLPNSVDINYLKYLKTCPINEAAEILGNEKFDFDSLDDKNKLPIDDCIKECLLATFAKIVSSRDVDKISWENDCYMTALMLIVLLKIEKWLGEFDETHKTNCVAKINTIASYFEESSEKSLYNALVTSADSERKKASDFASELQKEKKAHQDDIANNEKTIKENEKTIKDYNAGINYEKNKNERMDTSIRVHKVIIVILAFIVLSEIVLVFIFALRPRYSNDNLYDVLMALQPVSLVLSLGALIVVPFTIGSINRERYENKENDESKKSKKKKNDESQTSSTSTRKERRKRKEKKDDESQTS